jgi:hypothetical protein
VRGIVQVALTPSARAGEGCLLHRLGTIAANSRPALHQVLVCSSRDAQLSLSPETRGLDIGADLGPPQREARMLSEEIGPATRQVAKLGDGLVLVLDPAASTMPSSAGGYPRQDELVGRTHTCRHCRLGLTSVLETHQAEPRLVPPIVPHGRSNCSNFGF